MNQLSLVESFDGLGHGVVIGVALSAADGSAPASASRSRYRMLGGINRSSQHQNIERILGRRPGLRRRLPAERFPGPGVQRVSNGLDLLSTPPGQISTLWKVLS